VLAILKYSNSEKKFKFLADAIPAD
jgi:hypothetical protein